VKIVLASSNKHKVQEINDIVKSAGMSDFLTFVLPPQEFDPVENGNTYEENSFIKALTAWKLSRNWTLADDSGLCIDALGGRPGIYSARYAETPQKRIERVLEELNGIKERNAHFACAMTLINPEGNIEFSYTGICRGSIIYEAKGSNGFGYDPVFLPENSDKTMAELSEEDKNKISHRSEALRKVLEYINTNKKRLSY